MKSNYAPPSLPPPQSQQHQRHSGRRRHTQTREVVLRFYCFASSVSHAISTNKIDYEIFTKIYFQPNIEYEDALWPLSSLISLQMLTIRKTLELHCVSK